MLLPYILVVFVANYTPIVGLESTLKVLSTNLDNKFDFPTPESPINTILNKKSKS